MKISIKKILIIFCAFFLVCGSVFASYAISVPSLHGLFARQTESVVSRYEIVPRYEVVNPIEGNAGGRSLRGNALENVAKSAYKTFFRKGYRQIDVTYNNGKNGLDGVYVRYNKNGELSRVDIIEVKSGNASLRMDNKINAEQLTTKYNLDRIERSISEKKLKGKDVTEHQIAREFVGRGNYNAYKVRIDYKNGRLKVTQAKKIGEATNSKGQIVNKFGEMKEIQNFSYLDKDAKTLSPYQIQLKQQMFKEFESVLKQKGYSEKEVAEYMKQLRTNGNFDITRTINESERINIEEKSLEKVNSAYKAIKIGMLAIVVVMEIKSVIDWMNGNISTADFCFNTASNVIIASSLRISGLSSYLTPVFIFIDVIKNVWYWRHGQISLRDGIVNVLSNVVGLVVAGKASAATSAALAASFAGKAGVVGWLGGPIGSAIAGVAGLVVFAGVIFVSSSVAKWLGKKAVNFYDVWKEPARFNRIVSTIVAKYGI